MLDNTASLLADFAQVAKLSGLVVGAETIKHKTLPPPHKGRNLPNGYQAVYVFSLTSSPPVVLKVGKVGSKSGARFHSQHYNPNSSNSNLAKSLIMRSDLWKQLRIQSLDYSNVGNWILLNTDRDHFFISSDEDKNIVNQLEVFLQNRLHPLFEG